MGNEKFVGTNTPGYFEPMVTTLFLPGCANCGHKHPLAMKPVPTDTEHCPGCQQSVGKPGAPVEVPAEVAGGTLDMLVASWFLKIGKWLMSLRTKER